MELQTIGLGFIVLAAICYNIEIKRLKKRAADLEAALAGLVDFSEQAGFDCQRARRLLAEK